MKTYTQDEAEELYNAINWYQEYQPSHPLTCDRDSRHPLLDPILQSHEVTLRCIKCDYRQTYIPKCIVLAYRAYKGKDPWAIIGNLVEG